MPIDIDRLELEIGAGVMVSTLEDAAVIALIRELVSEIRTLRVQVQKARSLWIPGGDEEVQKAYKAEFEMAGRNVT